MIGEIKHLILVASGKGGVGKSTVATQLAMALMDAGHTTGLLDADIYGPSLPTLLGAVPRPQAPDGKRILPAEKFGLKLMSMGYLVDPETPMVWRGPMLAGAVAQFVTDVDWGQLDFLICDLPPGTGDVQLTLAQKFKVTGALLVTTPQAVALADVVRARAMFEKVKIPILGVVENMSYFLCDGCDKRHDIFASGGGAAVAKQLDLTLMAELPLTPALRAAGDAGQPLSRHAPDSPAVAAFARLAEKVVQRAQALRAERNRTAARRPGLPIVQA